MDTFQEGLYGDPEGFANRLVSELEEKAEFHRTNANDPHGIGTAVMVALAEVAQAIKDAQTMDKIKSNP